MKYLNLLFVALLFLAACHSHQHDEALEKAAQLHDEAIALEKKAKEELKNLVSMRNSIMVQGRELTAAEQATMGAVSALEARFNALEDLHIEVPGHEHSHDHDHHHDHDHSAAPNITSEDMLAAQQEFLDSMKAVHSDIMNFKVVENAPAPELEIKLEENE